MLRCILFLSVNLVLAQTPKLDSLYKSYEASTKIEDKMETLNRICIDYQSTDLEASYRVAQKIRKLSQEANYQRGVLLSQQNIALYYYYKSEMDSALVYFKKNADYALKNNKDAWLAQAYANIGSAYASKRDFYYSIYYREKAFEVALKNDDFVTQKSTLHNIGNIYNYIGDYDNAIIYYEKALTNIDNLAVDQLLFKRNLANAYLSKKNYSKTIALLEEETKKTKHANNYLTLAYAYSALGKAHAGLKHTEIAIMYFKQILDLSQYNISKNTLALAHLGLGKLYYNKKQLDLAIQEAKIGDQLAKDLGYDDLLFESNQLLFDIFKYKNEYQLAINYSSKALKYQDSLSQKKIKNTTTQRLIAYQKKLKDIEEANEKNLLKLSYNRNILISILSFIGVICFTLIYKNKRIRKEKNIAKLNLKQKIELEEKINKIEDNIAADLHDNFGNRLTAIQSAYNIVKEYNVEAKEKDDNYFKFSGHLEDKLFQLSTDIKDLLWAMNQNNNKVFPLIDRVLKIANAFEETTNKKVEIEIDMEKDYGFPKYTVKQLLLIIKEIIHNFDKHSKSDLLKIKFVSLNDKIRIVTQDFGVGFNMKDLGRINGLNNIRKRAESIGFIADFNSETNKYTKIELSSMHKLIY